MLVSEQIKNSWLLVRTIIYSYTYLLTYLLTYSPELNNDYFFAGHSVYERC